MTPKNFIVRYATQGLAHLFAQHPRLFIVGILIYLISPIDLLPEALLGPLGYLDDLVVILLPLFIRAYTRRHAGGQKPSGSSSRDYFDTTAR